MVEGKAGLRGAERTRRDPYAVQELTDRTTIRRLLEVRRAYAAYALGQLDDRFFPLVRCYRATGSAGEGLLLYSSAGLGNAVFAMGESGAVEAMLRLHRGPRHDYATCQPDHLDVFRRYFVFTQEQPMLRMAVRAADFAPAPLPLDGTHVRRLRAGDLRSLNALYGAEGAPAYYSAVHLREGVYFGVFDHGRLVSAAGTHVISEQWSIAVVGNVFTHPSYRRRGYAKLATGAVTAELLQRCQDVVLTVDPLNTPAVRAYRHLGYHEECKLLEAAVVRKDAVGIGSWLARAIARIRGRHQSVELVSD